MSNIRRKYNIHGKSVWIQGKTEQEVLEKGFALMNEARGDVFAKKHNFTEYALDWFENFSLPNIAEVTAVVYKRQLDVYILPALGKMNVEDITLSDVQPIFNRKGKKKVTLMKTKNVLNQIFRKAIDDDLMRKNPLNSPSFRLTGEASEGTKPFSVEEMRMMFGSIDKLTAPSDIAYLSIVTMQPLRLEEVLGLQWRDIDRDAMTLHISRAVTHPKRNMPIVKETKTKEKRDVPLTQATLDYLDSIPHGKPTDFVIGGESPCSYTQLRRMCERIERLIEYPGKITPRRFRATVLTDICEETGDIKLTQAAAGHKTADTALQHYVKGRKNISVAADVIENLYNPRFTKNQPKSTKTDEIAD